ncbi:hypothetical protein WJS89_02720 [Sphingomicrobium sp. XHP0235]|uniref:hypothetical protein n=1 Tax=Sphingomicrobium aquimarinum TaxID=3133971 RepID=UPI0031FED2A3
MQSSPALDAARDFLGVVWGGDPPADEELLRTLDCLVAAYYATPPGDVTDVKIDPPAKDGPSLYREIADRFPQFGLYPIADPSADYDDALMMADAIDDLADITGDMREVVWFAEHVSTDDAHFSFRLLFFHWGQHARSLAYYLHDRI